MLAAASKKINIREPPCELPILHSWPGGLGAGRLPAVEAAACFTLAWAPMIMALTGYDVTVPESILRPAKWRQSRPTAISRSGAETACWLPIIARPFSSRAFCFSQSETRHQTGRSRALAVALPRRFDEPFHCCLKPPRTGSANHS
jgi:hypothetical protein